jgi:hypothetical protein
MSDYENLIAMLDRSGTEYKTAPRRITVTRVVDEDGWATPEQIVFMFWENGDLQGIE